MPRSSVILYLFKCPNAMSWRYRMRKVRSPASLKVFSRDVQLAHAGPQFRPNLPVEDFGAGLRTSAIITEIFTPYSQGNEPIQVRHYPTASPPLAAVSSETRRTIQPATRAAAPEFRHAAAYRSPDGALGASYR